MAHGGGEIKLIAGFATPRDVMLHELRIESGFAEDEATAVLYHELAQADR